MGPPITIRRAFAMLFYFCLLISALVLGTGDGATAHAQAEIEHVPRAGEGPVRDPQLDPLMDEYNITWEPPTECAPSCWELVKVDILPDDLPPPEGSGGNICIYVILQDEDGQPLADEVWHTEYYGNTVPTYTKAPPEVSCFPMYGGLYYPHEGQSGPFSSYAGTYAPQSAIVRGMGLPANRHFSFDLVLRRRYVVPYTFALYLPTVMRNEPSTGPPKYYLQRQRKRL